MTNIQVLFVEERELVLLINNHEIQFFNAILLFGFLN